MNLWHNSLRKKLLPYMRIYENDHLMSDPLMLGDFLFLRFFFLVLEMEKNLFFFFRFWQNPNKA